MHQKTIRFMGGDATIEAHLEPFHVVSPLPEDIQKLLDLARRNIAWSWNLELIHALEKLDPEAWQKSDHNIVNFMNRLSLESLQKAASDMHLRSVFRRAFETLQEYENNPLPKELAYFCMEYGLTACLRLYSGGLGVLAGDHLKTASDIQLPLCAVGLAYKHGYFSQRLDSKGQQLSTTTHNNFEELPMIPVLRPDGQRLVVEVPFPGRNVKVQCWRVGVGGVSLYLLDSDVEGNTPEDRSITNNLYGGDSQHRLKQEILLGGAGYWVLKAQGIEPKVFHLNEGHAAFLVWARMIDLIQNKGLSHDEALEYVYQTSIFTTHTPVPAGHDVFSDDLMRPYLEVYAGELKSTVEAVANLGKISSSRSGGTFSMTDLALRGSSFVNGVSKIHGRVARKMFHEIYPGLHVSEVPVKGITNGVHLKTWMALEWQELYAREIGPNWFRGFDTPQVAQVLDSIRDETLWNTHLKLKRRLLNSVRSHVRETYERRGETPANTARALTCLNERALVIGFARRFAPYKRATLLFHHIERLEALVKAGYPIVILYAGKAHPHDKLGQEFIRQIIEISRSSTMQGRVLFVENYEMDIARELVQGCDVWLNTPTRPLEASGTSGMKAAINGCLNLSVDDGWWSEAYNGNNGWLVSDTELDENIEFQLEYDSAQICSLLETEVVPCFFDRDSNNIPRAWVERMKESMRSTTWEFSTLRMLRDYRNEFIDKAFRNQEVLNPQNFKSLRELTELKSRIQRSWNEVGVSDVRIEGLKDQSVKAGERLRVQATLSHPSIKAGELLVQAVVARPSKRSGLMKDFRAFDLSTPTHAETTRSQWSAEFSVEKAGDFSLGVRVMPRLETEASNQRVFMHLSKWY